MGTGWGNWELPPLFRLAMNKIAIVTDSVFVAGFDGALMPCDCLVDPVVMACWIPLRVPATGRRFGDALLALIHQVTSPPRPSHASVTALSMVWS